MTGWVVPGTHPGVEMSADTRFSGRVKRLIAVSSVALGIITWLAFADLDRMHASVTLLGVAWLTMPALLALSLSRPRLRYFLVVPAGCASVGLPAVALSADVPTIATLGWWLATAGVWMGATMGTWLWFRVVRVPSRLDHPFSKHRWALVTLHAALVTAGVILVAVGRLA